MSEKKVLIFGLHSVESLLKRNASAIYELLIQKDRQDKRMMQVIEMAKKQGLKPQTVTARTLDEKTQSGAHQGIMAICQPQDQLHEADLPAFLDSIEHPFILVLDGVQDPHNLGACLRSAEAAGVHLVIAPRDRAVGLTPVVRKVASGAAENIPFVQVTNLVRTLTLFKERGIWLYGAAGEAKDSIFKTSFTKSCAIIMGAEGEGLRRLTQDTCDYLVKIPMAGQVESLNVSVATGIFLFQVLQQRTL